MGYVLLLIHFSMLYHDTYITSPFIIIFCCSILKKVFFPNEHCFIKKFVHAVTAYQFLLAKVRQSGQYPQWKNRSLSVYGRSPNVPPNVLPRQPVHGYHFPQYGSRYNGPPPYHKRYGPLRQVSLGGKAVKMAENLFFQRIGHSVPVVHILQCIH